MKSKVIISAIILILALSFNYSFADVPQMINYQGKLTNPSGILVDGLHDIIFSIYNNEGDAIPVWAETLNVDVQYGVFSVLLGDVHSIPYNIFDGTVKYLSIKVEDDDEMTPRKKIVSVAYAYRAATVQSGGFDCSDCDERFVNVLGPDSVVTEGDSLAFMVRALGTGSPQSIVGIKSYSENTMDGSAIGGVFYTSPSGTGWHYGISAAGYGSSGSSALGTSGYGENSSVGRAVGAHGLATNSSTGEAYGGLFSSNPSGTGDHFGVYASAHNSSAASSYGLYSFARNSTTGLAYGGFFETEITGTGDHYGIRAESYGSSPAYIRGIYASAENGSTGDARAAQFYTSGLGSGYHAGIVSNSYGNSPSLVDGVYSYAANSSTGSVYAGYFYTPDAGTGNKYGVYATAPPAEGYAGYFNGDVYIDDSLVVKGGKSAAVKVDNGEYRLLYSQESPEVWFEDFGEGQLINGRVHIDLDPLFLETVTINDQHPIKVFIQLNDLNCMGTAVIRGTTGFDVVELQNGTSNAVFSYRVVAKRRGFENIRLAQMGGPTPEEVAAEQVKREVIFEQERMKMEEERMEREKEREKRREEEQRMVVESMKMKQQLR